MPKHRQIEAAKFDHCAIAVNSWSDAWELFVHSLGGRWRSGGQNFGFAPAQLVYENEGKIELLMPYEPQQNDFLLRFLSKHGPGAHHFTFKVPNLKEALEVLEANNISPTGVDLTNPWWKEAFIYPKQAFGIVVQLAQSLGTWFTPPPEGFPSPEKDLYSDFVWVGHAVANIKQALEFFVDVLGGQVISEGFMFDGKIKYQEISWSSPTTIKLLTDNIGNEINDFLLGRPGKVHHLAFKTKHPDAIKASSYISSEDAYEIKPDQKTNVRILIYPKNNGK